MIRSLLNWLNHLCASVDDENMIEHVPVANNHKAKAHRKKLAEAARNHGKPFKVAPTGMKYERVGRVEPPSDQLKKIEAESKRQREAVKLAKTIEDQTNVTRLGKR